jgi:hypothetical protein
MNFGGATFAKSTPRKQRVQTNLSGSFGIRKK